MSKIMFFLLGLFAKKKQEARPTPQEDRPPESDLVAIINEVRKAHGVKPVFEDLRLDQAAKIQADFQAQIDRCTHFGPTADLQWVSDRVRFVGLDDTYDWLGEVCAEGEKAFWPSGAVAIEYDFRKTCDDWLSSPEHSQILLDGAATHAGACQKTNMFGRTYSTAVFITKKAGAK